MQLLSFSVSNYRSITAAQGVSLSQKTILIGRNNEGKSNVLRALQTSMQLLQHHSQAEIRPIRLSRLSDEYYQWNRDFPLKLQRRSGTRQTVFRLEFGLSEDETGDLKRAIGSNLKGSLPLEITIGKEHNPEFRVVKSGSGTKSLAQKSQKIAKFVAERIHFSYIPAVRTDRDTLELIRHLLSQELRTLEHDTDYQNALSTISRLQQPILEKLGNQVQGALKTFLPSIKGVKIEISDSGRRYALRHDVAVIIDDGTPTSIEHKGDGVKSLAALGLLRSQQARAGASILAIEEPESHLHPEAIHQINEIIDSISTTTQVILTTHNPLFVDRTTVTSNILVTEGGARPAKTIGAIRDLLGVRASDNLSSASFVLVVEGKEDVVALRALLPILSEKVGRALRNHQMVIEPIGGAGNLSYKLSLLRTFLCATHTLLDGDDAGRTAYMKAESDGLISVATCTYINCRGLKQAEFEDCLELSVYLAAVQDEFGVDLSRNEFKGNDKWSYRLKNCFMSQGKDMNDALLARVKMIVAQAVERTPATALNIHKRSSIDALVTSLERALALPRSKD
ncbi:ATP-dependent nuclease [Comamonas terrigena]|uniref:ATP-dependent nuclease n=1 Tax=Comamonas terrigena TaxID=32013 RepID=UPI0023540C33|nr:AAA family ATPase [Comamonas terrigena]